MQLQLGPWIISICLETDRSQGNLGQMAGHTIFRIPTASQQSCRSKSEIPYNFPKGMYELRPAVKKMCQLRQFQPHV